MGVVAIHAVVELEEAFAAAGGAAHVGEDHGHAEFGDVVVESRNAGNHQREVVGLLGDAEALHVGDHPVHQFAGGAAAVGLQRAPLADLATGDGFGMALDFPARGCETS